MYPASSWINLKKYNNIQKELSKLKVKFSLPFLSMNSTVNVCSSLLLNQSFEILHFLYLIDSKNYKEILQIFNLAVSGTPVFSELIFRAY